MSLPPAVAPWTATLEALRALCRADTLCNASVAGDSLRREDPARPVLRRRAVAPPPHLLLPHSTRTTLLTHSLAEAIGLLVGHHWSYEAMLSGILDSLFEYFYDDAALCAALVFRNADGRTAFACALRAGNLYLARRLLAFEPRALDASSRAGKTPLHEACEVGTGAGATEVERSLAVVALLLDARAHVGARTRCGMTPTHLAIRAGRLDIMHKLMRRGGAACALYANACDASGNTPLHTAVYWRSLEVVQYLLGLTQPTLPSRFASLVSVAYSSQRLVYVDASNNAGDTPLHVAARLGAAKMCEALVDAGANRHRLNGAGQTPLALLKVYAATAAAAEMKRDGAK